MFLCVEILEGSRISPSSTIRMQWRMRETLSLMIRDTICQINFGNGLVDIS